MRTIVLLSTASLCACAARVQNFDEPIVRQRPRYVLYVPPPTSLPDDPAAGALVLGVYAVALATQAVAITPPQRHAGAIGPPPLAPRETRPHPNAPFVPR